MLFEDGSRIIVRLSGTGSSGATVRIYVDSYETDENLLLGDAQVCLRILIMVIHLIHFSMLSVSAVLLLGHVDYGFICSMKSVNSYSLVVECIMI